MFLNIFGGAATELFGFSYFTSLDVRARLTDTKIKDEKK